MHVDWSDGIPPWAGIQTATPQNAWIIRSDSRHSAQLHIELSRNDDYQRVANGVPRAEVSLGKTRIVNGRDYILDWSTSLPEDFPIDNAQPEIVTQILEGGNRRGAPPVALVINGDHYEMRVHSDVPHSMRALKFGSVPADRGKTVCWRLHYIPGTVGEKSTTELDKNGQRVVAEYNRGNAYAGDDQASVKVGVYKWLWRKQASDVEHLSIEYGNVTLYGKKSLPADAANPSRGESK
nr:heparin lyase I family protein [Caballeronia zhejiangensis]